MPVDTSKLLIDNVGDYEILEKIAEGGMGTVYKGRHRHSGQIVAVKIVPPHLASNAVLVKRFEQEFRAASRLDHPNIVRALDYGEANNMPYLVMEYVEGESLGQKIEREGQLSEAEAIRIVAQVAQGLHRAHKQGLIHRDVKPDNILVAPDGVAKLADLGLVKEMETDLNLTKTGRGLGTPHFMAPEQFRNAKNVDIRCDIYSLGATLYMMVTGELPFRSSGPLDAWMKKINNELTPPRTLVPSISDRIDWAIRRAMSADPDQRPTSCREFVEDLIGHTTRKSATVSPSTGGAEAWFLVYRDDDGTAHTVKGNIQGIRRSLREGLLGDAANIRASRDKNGPFEPLRGFPEFRDLVVSPAPMTAARIAAPSSAETPPPPGRRADTPPNVKSLPRTGSSARMPALPAATAKTDTATSIPHIELAPGRYTHVDWVKWILLLIIAVATTVIAWFVLPQLTK